MQKAALLYAPPAAPAGTADSVGTSSSATSILLNCLLSSAVAALFLLRAEWPLLGTCNQWVLLAAELVKFVVSFAMGFKDSDRFCKDVVYGACAAVSIPGLGRVPGPAAHYPPRPVPLATRPEVPPETRYPCVRARSPSAPSATTARSTRCEGTRT